MMTNGLNATAGQTGLTADVVQLQLYSGSTAFYLPD